MLFSERKARYKKKAHAAKHKIPMMIRRYALSNFTDAIKPGFISTFPNKAAANPHAKKVKKPISAKSLFSIFIYSSITNQISSLFKFTLFGLRGFNALMRSVSSPVVAVIILCKLFAAVRANLIRIFDVLVSVKFAAVCTPHILRVFFYTLFGAEGKIKARNTYYYKCDCRQYP